MGSVAVIQGIGCNVADSICAHPGEMVGDEISRCEQNMKSEVAVLTVKCSLPITRIN